ncbi:MAG: amidohydrolase family protein, partial [Chryseolinea sp.]
FWSWREAMYRCALSMSPDEVESVATMLYSEMLRNGYTHVAEFHYLHHNVDGRKYSNSAEMGERLVSAARTAGIKITLIPIFYQKGNFGTDPYPQQRRFISSDTDDYLQLLDDSARCVMQYDHARLGFGVHSLRAVSSEDVIRTFNEGPPGLPFHLHAAEQLKEISDAEQFLKARPVQWLIDNMPLSNRFNIVHCTHMSDVEVNGLAASGANVVLCPGTEGNLGDGIFRLTDYEKSRGSFCIGTDSHISLNPLEDLRWLDYAQRFTTHRRNTFDDGATAIIRMIYESGRMATGSFEEANYFSVGLPFDAVVYNSKMPLLTNARAGDPLPSIVYSSDSSSVYGTIVNGRWIVKKEHHMNRESIMSKYRKAVKSIVGKTT